MSLQLFSPDYLRISPKLRPFHFWPDFTVFPWSSELGQIVFFGEKFPHYCVFLNDGVPYDGSGGGDVYHDDGDHDF